MKSDEINGIGFDDLTNNNTTTNLTTNNKNSYSLNKIGRKLAFFGEKLAENDTNHVVLENENDNLSDDNHHTNINKNDESKYKRNNHMKKNQSNSKDSSQEDKS
jgi:hypothetical protein